MMGDIVDVGSESPHLRARIVGTGPIDTIEVRNGINVIKQLRPFNESDLGHRIKIIWGGARVRGRDRLVKWDGNLDVLGNSIMAAETLNFWNANYPLDQINNQRLTWKSVTTGGTAGIILTIAK
jgi:hypothetical protein